MKKTLSILTLACCMFCTQYGYSEEAMKAPNAAAPAKAEKPVAPAKADAPVKADAPAMKGASDECPSDHPAEDQPAGECYCLYVHYEPCYYTTQRCIEEKIPCKKKCWRKVPKQYEVKRCRMVPEYYTETCTKYENEEYEVDVCKTVKKVVCDQHCKYVPQYYWKHTCTNEECPEKKK